MADVSPRKVVGNGWISCEDQILWMANRANCLKPLLLDGYVGFVLVTGVSEDQILWEIFWVFFCIGFMLYLDLLKHPPGVRILRFSFVSSNK